MKWRIVGSFTCIREGWTHHKTSERMQHVLNEKTSVAKHKRCKTGYCGLVVRQDSCLENDMSVEEGQLTVKKIH